MQKYKKKQYNKHKKKIYLENKIASKKKVSFFPFVVFKICVPLHGKIMVNIIKQNKYEYN